MKFRAWDKQEKKMIEVNKLTLDPSTSFSYCANCGLHIGQSGHHYELMQYTGLKDKNGKEIYFDCSILRYGDIIFIIELYNKEFGFICPSIKWLKGSRDWNYNEWAYDHNYDCEIIGNIYENPELLAGDGNG